MSTNVASKTKALQRESDWDNANILSKYCFWFMVPLFKKGWRRSLNFEDISAAPEADRSRVLGSRLEENYNYELNNRSQPSFLRAIWKTFGPQLVLFSMMDLVAKCFAFPLQTITLGWLIRDTAFYLNLANPDPLRLNSTPVLRDIKSNATSSPLPIPVPSKSLSFSEAYWQIVIDALLLVVSTMLATILSQPYFFQTVHIGMKCRVAACHLIYRKALKLSQSALSETTAGQMVNLLSNDVNRFDQVTMSIPYLWIAPLQGVIVIAILSISYLGVLPTLATLGSILMYVLIQTLMGRGFSKFRDKTAQRTDERVRLMNEIILAIRIIKMYAWEKPFKQLVQFARKREIATIGIATILKTINQTLFFVSSKIIVFVTLMIYLLLGNPLEAEIVFVTIGLANLLRLSLTLFFPNAVAVVAETIISCKRINAFLLLPELDSSQANYQVKSDCYNCDDIVSFEDVYASWKVPLTNLRRLNSWDTNRASIVRNLSMQIKSRELVLVVGRVGSGKSSLLMSLLGELPVTSGMIKVNGRISYASQEAWIFSGTVRDNILFGKNYEPERYKDVIKVCSLERDLDILFDGDLTIVGERGVSLSGGQKARVNLARALYNDADLYLLDDPLSAVDAPVARHIFNKSLRTFLRKKTVVLATHQLQFLRHASKVLVMDRDLPPIFGTLDEVRASKAFAQMNYGADAFADASAIDGDSEIETNSRRLKARVRRGSPGTVSVSSSAGPSSETAVEDFDGDDEDDEQAKKGTREDEEDSANSTEHAKSSLTESKQSTDEADQDSKGGSTKQAEFTLLSQEDPDEKEKRDRQQGTEALSSVSTNISTYLYYISNAGGVLMFIWFVAANVICQTVYQLTDYFLSEWTDSVQRRMTEGNRFEPTSLLDRLTESETTGYYGALVLLCLVLSFVRTSTLFAATLKASISMHDKLFNSVINAPMRFFDFSPIGILLNRLSRDIGIVDETLPTTLIEIVSIFVNIAGIIALAMFIDQSVILFGLLLFFMAFLLGMACARTITRLKQMEGVTKSPVYSHLSTTLCGLPTIRAFKSEENFMHTFDHYQDVHSSAWFGFLCSSRWLNVSMDWLCLIFITSVITVLIAISLEATNASLVGLLISQIMILPSPFQYGMRQLIEFESQMTSVQRVKEYSELESESKVLDGYDDEQKKELDSRASSPSVPAVYAYQAGLVVPSPTWTESGEICFNNVTLSYFSDEPPVLKELNFTVKACEKVGIVGRTGAGKSSIVSVLFRLYKFQGQVEIDGRDTKSLSLFELRRSMSIIPQDPILFGGTIRKNLDPFSEFSEKQLWDALEAVQLKPLFARYDQGLDFLISEGGANFSVGQRQLICLARAIVRRNKILILDEATANVDPETDSFIQRTIAKQFAQCTVLTIAHRLITIVDSDRVLVLDRGQVKEFAEPFELIKDESSLFTQMVNSSAQQAPRIKRLIDEAHRKRTANR